jgi:hypothetical protein
MRSRIAAGSGVVTFSSPAGLRAGAAAILHREGARPGQSMQFPRPAARTAMAHALEIADARVALR